MPRTLRRPLPTPTPAPAPAQTTAPAPVPAQTTALTSTTASARLTARLTARPGARPTAPAPSAVIGTLLDSPFPATALALSRPPTDPLAPLDPVSTGSPTPLAPPASAPLHPEEQRLLGTLPPARHPDFTAGRIAAARALRALGVEGPVLRDGRRPVFPAGSHGSISHCVGHIGACLASVHPRVVALGTDLERTDRLSWDAARLVCTPRERDWAARARRPESRLAVVFSAKEAIYKALSALGAPAPVFHDIELSVVRGRLVARPARGLLPARRRLLGWVRLLPGNHVMTSVAVLVGGGGPESVVPFSVAHSMWSESTFDSVPCRPPGPPCEAGVPLVPK
ncbi:4'-phosphopantetheinyl transferase superfamily protein [Streptomyces sp. JNUCC 64]